MTREGLHARVIGEMATCAADARLQPWRVGPRREHVPVMIGFEDEGRAALKCSAHCGIHLTEVGEESQRGAPCVNEKPHGLGGIVRLGDHLDFQRATTEGLARSERRMGCRTELSFFRSRRECAFGAENTSPRRVCHSAHMGDMVSMLVREQDGFRSACTSNAGHAFCNLGRGDARVQEDRVGSRLNEDRVSPAAAAKHGKLKPYRHGRLVCVARTEVNAKAR